MNSFIKKGITIILSIVLFSSLATITSCSFEDEIVIEPGNLVIYNNSDLQFELTIKNIDNEDQTVVSESILKSNSQESIPLEKGYAYEAIAIENNPEKSDPTVFTKTFLIDAHQDTEWCIPSK
ncbi:MAG: hypothetical protein K8R86_02575 [Bacteroidales bacterium]|nr:hypothetical protein [Bacteroidales bacterium]